jgi:ankyrin repeat protein
VRSRNLGDFSIPVPSLHHTPLHIAAEAGDLAMMQLLVGHGAVLDVRDTAGSTPLHLALEAQVGEGGRERKRLPANAAPSSCNNP